MKVKITYTLSGDTQEHEDILRWPDLATLEEVTPHVTHYLDTLYGQGQYSLVTVEEVA